MKSKEAWVTLACNDDYAIGALVLGQSQRNVGSTKNLHVLITSGVSEAIRKNLTRVFDDVTEVDPLNLAEVASLKRPDLAALFVKLYSWCLVQYSKCLFVEADCLVIQNSDELFDKFDEFSAAPDVCWPDVFNTGVFVLRPSFQTYHSLLQFVEQKGKLEGDEGALLNMYFSQWKSFQANRMPFVYNTSSSVSYTYISAFKRFYEDIKIVHFTGDVKPWHYKYNVLSGNLTNVRAGFFNVEHVRLWWTTFVRHLMPFLFELPKPLSISDEDEGKAPAEPIHYYYQPPRSSSPTPHGQQEHGPPKPPYHHDEEQCRSQLQYKPETAINYYYTPPSEHHYHHWQPDPTPAPQPPPLALPFIACVAFNIEPPGYAYQPAPEPQKEFWPGKQQQDYQHHHDAQHQHTQPEPLPIHYVEQPWQPPQLPSFVGAYLAAADRNYDQAPRVWPPLLAQVAQMLAESAKLQNERGLPAIMDPEEATSLLLELTDKVEQELLNRPLLDKDLSLYPCYEYGRRLTECPVCSESLSYLDEYFPVDDGLFEIEDFTIEKDPNKSRPERRINMKSEREEDEFDYEDYEHKLAWEQGAVDYRGRDSWDNIMQHLLKSFEN